MMPLNEVTIAKIKRNIEKGNTVNYICCHLGVGKTAVYRLLNTTPEEYEIYRQHRKEQRKTRPRERRREVQRHGYRLALPEERWDGARAFLEIVHRLKVMNLRTRADISLEALRSAWQKRMAERVN